MDDYDTRKIREFLHVYFSDEDLTALCFDEFPEVYEAFGTGWGKPLKVQQLLGYCRTHSQYERLLPLLRKERPEAYKTKFGDDKTEIRFILPINLESLSVPQVNDQIEGFRASLASVLGIPVDLLEVTSIAPSNSVIVTVRLPLSVLPLVMQLGAREKRELGLIQDPVITEEEFVALSTRATLEAISSAIEQLLETSLATSVERETEGMKESLVSLVGPPGSAKSSFLAMVSQRMALLESRAVVSEEIMSEISQKMVAHASTVESLEKRVEELQGEQPEKQKKN